MSVEAPVSRDLLRQLAEAWRGDWSNFDGRSLRTQLITWDLLLGLELSDSPVDAETTTEVITTMAEAWRDSIGLCTHGRGQWVSYCSDSCEEA